MTKLGRLRLVLRQNPRWWMLMFLTADVMYYGPHQPCSVTLVLEVSCKWVTSCYQSPSWWLKIMSEKFFCASLSFSAAQNISCCAPSDIVVDGRTTLDKLPTNCHSTAMKFNSQVILTWGSCDSHMTCFCSPLLTVREYCLRISHLKLFKKFFLQFCR